MKGEDLGRKEPRTGSFLDLFVENLYKIFALAAIEGIDEIGNDPTR